MKTDAHIKADVTDELAWDPAVNATGIGVAVKDGVVTLTGHLDSYAEKHAVEQAVHRVAGVRGIAVELDVRLATEHKRSDSDIAQAAAMSGFGSGPLLIRWNLKSGYSYEEARTRFTPFDQLIDEDSATRDSIAQLCMATIAAGHECTIIANNKAEGSAPLTLVKLAQAIVTAARHRAQAG